MAYAVFNGDPYYHLIRSSRHETLCGLRTINRKGEQGEYLPLASVTNTLPHPGLFSPCPRCEAIQGGAKAAD